MTDAEKREKVIRALELCAYGSLIDCERCPYYTEERCSENLCADALALLNEQDEGIEPIESTYEQKKFADRIGIAVSDFWCGACHFNLMGHPKFCPNCGKAVKWDG